MRDKRSWSVLAAVVSGALIVPVVSGSPSNAQAPQRDAARGAVQKALPLLQSSARTWYEKRECFSCHHQGLGVLATALARERGFAIDETMFRGQIDRRSPGQLRDGFIIGETTINEQIGQSFRAITVGALKRGLDPLEALRLHMLMGKQHVSGRWSSYSHRPPLEDSEFTATAMTIRTLKMFGQPARQEEIDRRIGRAAAWLAGAKPGSSEERAMALFGLAWAAAPRATIDRTRAAVLADQRPDGGWAQIAGRASDAYATGQALVALNQAGRLPSNAPPYTRGVSFLLRTQKPDGSWLVTTRRSMSPGLPYFETGFPHEEDQFISYAASAWAVMALTLALDGSPSSLIAGLPPSQSARAPTWVDPYPEDPLTPLMRAALAGSADDVARLLQSGADVNAATKMGLTALMCAAHDPAKVKLLVDARAHVDARTKTGHTALIIAAGYDGAAEAVRLLLDRAADPNASATEGILPGPPLLRAAARGDKQVMTQLLERGARADSAANAMAILAAVAQWDVETVRFLLDRGLPPNARLKIADIPIDPTALMLAAEDAQPAIVRMLLERGADVNARDSGGRTSLMFAAGAIDRGNGDIDRTVDLLLKAGADPTLRTPHGDSALSYAERFRNAGAAARLSKATGS